MQWGCDAYDYLHLLRSLTIFTPGIVRLPDMDGLVASERVWIVADDPEGVESASTEGLG
jgi:hypothetical protein